MAQQQQQQPQQSYTTQETNNHNTTIKDLLTYHTIGTNHHGNNLAAHLPATQQLHQSLGMTNSHPNLLQTQIGTNHNSVNTSDGLFNTMQFMNNSNTHHSPHPSATANQTTATSVTSSQHPGSSFNLATALTNNNTNSNNPTGSYLQTNSGANSAVGSNISTGSDDGTILFIGDLSRTVKEEELHTLFSPFGSIVAIDIKRDKLTFNNLGYGFVQFSNRTEAAAAKKSLNHYELNSRKIRIGWAQKNTTLFVGDLDGTITTEDLIRVFEVFGPIVTEESFVKEPSRKYGFVRFGSRDDAERAKSDMNHKVLGSRPIRIGWGDSNFEKHCVHIQFDPNACHITTGMNVNSIFHEQFFMDSFTPFATPYHSSIINISLPKHNNTKKLKGFAFIHFEENEAGEKAAILALQTLTNQFDGLPPATHLQDGSRTHNPTHYVHHLQQSFSPRQGQGHHAPQTTNGTPNNNTQQHLLGGIPVKYSFGKRQIFSRHRRANENAAAAAAAATMQSSMAMMMHGMMGGAAGSPGLHAHNSHLGRGHHGGHGGGRQGGGFPGGNRQPYNTNHTNHLSPHLTGQPFQNNQFLPFVQQQPGGAQPSQQQATQQTNHLSLNNVNRYATNTPYITNPSGSIYPTSTAHLSPNDSPTSPQSQAAFLIQSLAAQQQQYPNQVPLAVQQFQQAYQQMQQQQQQQPNGNNANSDATSLAFLNAQNQLFSSSQPSSPIQTNLNNFSPPLTGHSNMAQLMADLQSLGLSSSQQSSPNTTQLPASITSGHSSISSTPTNHANTTGFFQQPTSSTHGR